MSTKHDSKCLQRAADDEPIFVLRATDSIAPFAIFWWAARLERTASALDLSPEQRKHVEDKLADARRVATEMTSWAVKHGGAKLPL